MLDEFRSDYGIETMGVEKEDDLSKLEIAQSSFDLFTSPLDLLSLPSSSSDLILPEEIKYRPYMFVLIN